MSTLDLATIMLLFVSIGANLVSIGILLRHWSD